MLQQTLLNTPRWVWLLLLALVWLGVRQTVRRSASLGRITALPLLMTGLSLSGTLTTFGADAPVLVAWLGAAMLSALLVFVPALPAQAHYDAATRRFQLPGSWLPLALILGLFVTKYAVGAASAMQPALAHNVSFRLGFAALYGAFSGVFLARGARLWRLALQSSRGAGTIVAP